MSAVEGTVHFDTPSSVTLRLKKRDIVYVTGSSQRGDTALIPRPTGSEVKRMVAEGALEAHPFFSSMTAAKLSSRICRIAERAEFRAILQAGQWNSRAQAILEAWLLKAPRQKARTLAIEDAAPDAAVPSVAAVSASSSSSSSSSPSSSSDDADENVNGDSQPGGSLGEGAASAEHDADGGGEQSAAVFDVRTLADDEVEQHPHWVSLSMQADSLVEDNERMLDELQASEKAVKRLRDLTDTQARLISMLQEELRILQQQ